MSLVDAYLVMFLVGTIGTVLIALLVGVSMGRYRRELREVGDAQTPLGVIGSAYLEGKAQVLVAISVGVPIGLMCGGGVWLLSEYVVTLQNMILASGLLLGSLLIFIGLLWKFGNGKARLEARRVLRNYFSHRSEEILRLELVRLHNGNETQRKAFELIAERGSKASLVAGEVLEELAGAQ
ncbi:MAG: hypothetical protein ACE5H4_14875 [Candidatus Thorarchaeota archaeon]